MGEAVRDVTVAHRPFRLGRKAVEGALAGELAEPVKSHYVVVGGRRYPPKQVLAVVTGLPRSAFTTHQALRVLRNLGLNVGREVTSTAGARSTVSRPPGAPAAGTDVRRRPSAEALEPHVGEWVAVRGTKVLVGALTVREVVSWLSSHRQTADGMFRVPRDRAEASGAAPR